MPHESVDRLNSPDSDAIAPFHQPDLLRSVSRIRTRRVPQIWRPI
jgi:hypothetical protein